MPNASYLDGKYCDKVGNYLSIGEYVCLAGMPIFAPLNCTLERACGSTYEIKSSFGQVIDFLTPRISTEGKVKLFAKICLSIHHKDLPSGSQPLQTLPMTDQFTVYTMELERVRRNNFVQDVERQNRGVRLRFWPVRSLSTRASLWLVYIFRSNPPRYGSEWHSMREKSAIFLLNLAEVKTIFAPFSWSQKQMNIKIISPLYYRIRVRT
jgi:hypothetical protein